MAVRRRILPAVLTLLSLMVDTSVIPFLIESPYIVSLTFITVLVIGVHLDRMHGMLYGLIAGLLQDILVGYQLGFNAFVYIILGFLAGLIAYEPEDVRARRRPSMVYLRRALTFAGMTLVRELAIYAYQYFGTARIEGIYFLNILIRTLITVALCMLLGPLESRIVQGRGARYRRTSAKREVKSF